MKEDQNNWEKEFDELPLAVAYKQGGQEIVDFDYLKDQMERIVKPWIKSNMVSKAEMREWLKSQRKKDIDYSIPENKYAEFPKGWVGYNEAIDQTLSKLNEN